MHLEDNEIDELDLNIFAFFLNINAIMLDNNSLQQIPEYLFSVFNEVKYRIFQQIS